MVDIQYKLTKSAFINENRNPEIQITKLNLISIAYVSKYFTIK